MLRIGNASGFYGDRFSAFEEMLTGGPLDVLTGDYLAELTMLILGRDRARDPDGGYARTFLRQLEAGLGLAADAGVRVVTNAGGLNPAGLAARIRELGERVGVPVRVAYVTGDDLLGERDRWAGAVTANAYLGGGGIAACLRAGADVVVTGRVTDAALVSGAAAAHYGWGDEDLDALAGAVVAGHILECGAQATGGNYAFFGEHDIRHPGFPLAEIHPDGSAVITKHPGTGGAVTTGTVTAQLLYETEGARYPGPDVTARLDTVRLTPDGPDRVRVHGVRGEPPPATLKVGVTRAGGWRNEIVFVLTGLDVVAKARVVQGQFEDVLARLAPARVRWTLARTDHLDASVQEEASALLRLVVHDPDPDVVGRALSGAAVELALASVPGLHLTAPPGPGAPYGVLDSAYVPADGVPHVAVLPDGTRIPVPPAAPATGAPAPPPEPALPAPLPAGPARHAPLGLVAGARSGDKGGRATVGVWARSEDAWRWLAHELTVERFRHLLPETAGLPVERHVLPRLRALGFVVDGLLGRGVAENVRFDPQAKAVGEWLRARYLEIPEVLL
ncbi:acyclic terpene utilization AtuA family protein [Streptomyces caatingaensis]|uniref:Exopolyphosphatase n=1 Tax=Streptomyces caatingaensis TaxID=1678637 RepID=A0A0K9XDM3_9ACTN|nr:acyclic terpene utilization AtuA family protein [Streptomyces caatingaensis]KNB51534.1 exopolyphosphatase [Streptomyces caatingaensis]